VTGPAKNLDVSPNPIPAGATVINDGGGCGGYASTAQSVAVEIFDAIAGGNAIVSKRTSVDANGRWGPLALKLPSGRSTEEWGVFATCTTSTGDAPDQSGYGYSASLHIPGGS
jgi:hypothetical protein